MNVGIYEKTACQFQRCLEDPEIPCVAVDLTRDELTEVRDQLMESCLTSDGVQSSESRDRIQPQDAVHDVGEEGLLFLGQDVLEGQDRRRRARIRGGGQPTHRGWKSLARGEWPQQSGSIGRKGFPEGFGFCRMLWMMRMMRMRIHLLYCAAAPLFRPLPPLLLLLLLERKVARDLWLTSIHRQPMDREITALKCRREMLLTLSQNGFRGTDRIREIENGFLGSTCLFSVCAR